MRLALILLLCVLGTARGLGPHEVLLLVNRSSPASLHVANEYAALRGIPDENVVRLALPDSVLEPQAEISPTDFVKYIWEPARRAIEARGLGDRILAWVYSVDFPVRVATWPPMSLQGMTLTGGRAPTSQEIEKGTWLSPLFAGPDRPDGPVAESRGLRWFRDILGDRMPVPSMMLGFTGSRGTDVTTVLECLRKGASSDGTKPAGTVFFVVSDDVRSKCRAWQYPAAQRELAALGVKTAVVPRVPGGASMLGAMLGCAWGHLMFAGEPTYVPGCVVDNLTSAGAIFNNPDQTKLTHWLLRGATASEGTVFEPLAIWTKFPSARFFAHYANGCTILESFFQSIRCPLQILLVGDPLARPFAPPLPAVLKEAPAEAGRRMFTLQVGGDVPAGLEYSFWLDGKPLARRAPLSSVEVDESRVGGGYHTLRGVAETTAPVPQEGSALAEFWVTRSNQFLEIRGIPEGGQVDLTRPVSLSVEAAEGAEDVRILRNGEVLEPPAAAGETYELDPRLLGAGPAALQARARFPGGGEVFSRPIRLTVADRNQPPVIAGVKTDRTADDGVTLVPSVSDPEGDPLTTDWFVPMLPVEEVRDAFGDWTVTGGRLAPSNGFACLETSGDLAVGLWTPSKDARPSEIRADVAISPGRWSMVKDQLAGIVFNYRSPKDFDYFVMMGGPNSWSIGHCRKGKLEPAVSRGTWIRPERWYSMGVRKEVDGVLSAYVNDRKICSWPDRTSLGGKAGVMAGPGGACFRNAALDLRGMPAGEARFEGGRVFLPRANTVAWSSLLLRVSDPSRSVYRSVPVKEP